MVFFLTVGKNCDILCLMIAYLRKGLILGLVLSLTLSPLILRAAEPSLENQPPLEEPEEPTAGEDLGYGVGSVLASMFYSPFKITYAGLGLITGGLGFLLSAGRADVANNIIYPALRGNYVITPSHLKGIEPVIFVGPPYSDSQPEEISPAAPPPPALGTEADSPLR